MAWLACPDELGGLTTTGKRKVLSSRSPNANIKDVLERKTSISHLDEKASFNAIPGETINVRPRSKASKKIMLDDISKQLRFEFTLETGVVYFEMLINGEKTGPTLEYTAQEKHKFIYQPGNNGLGELKIIWNNKSLLQSKRLKFCSIIEGIALPRKNPLKEPPSNEILVRTNSKTETKSEEEINGSSKLIEEFNVHFIAHENIDTFDASTMGGTFGHLTSIEREKLIEFKAMVSPKDIKAIKIPFEDDDYVLLRYLRARKFVIKDAKLMWDNHVEYRTDTKLEAMLKLTHEEVAGLNLNELCSLYPTGK